MNSSYIICPCGRWHKAATIATEKYVQRFRCGLRCTLKAGHVEYRYKGKDILVLELAGGQAHLFVRLGKSEA